MARQGSKTETCEKRLMAIFLQTIDLKLELPDLNNCVTHIHCNDVFVPICVRSSTARRLAVLRIRATTFSETLEGTPSADAVNYAMRRKASSMDSEVAATLQCERVVGASESVDVE
jgi:hypothetical protein